MAKLCVQLVADISKTSSLEINQAPYISRGDCALRLGKVAAVSNDRVNFAEGTTLVAPAFYTIHPAPASALTWFLKLLRPHGAQRHAQAENFQSTQR